MSRSADGTAGPTRQNQPGEIERPVRFRRRYVFAGTAVRDRGRSRFLRRALLLIISNFLCGLAAFLVTWVGLVPASSRYDLHFGLLVLAVLTITAAHIWLDGQGPRRAQDAYLEASGAPGLSGRQHSLLALASVTDFERGWWNSSLEHHPSWAVLPARLRRRWHDGDAGNPWAAMPMAPMSVLRDHLDTEFRVSDEESLRLHLLDRLDADSISLGFLHAVRSGRTEVATRIASLTGTSTLDVLACAEPRHGRPPVLLWGEDLRQLVGVVRLGFAAGYVSRDNAWTMLEQVGEVAAALFGSAEEYWDNVRLGYAARTDSLAELRSFDHARGQLWASSWPASCRSFPRPGTGTVPDVVRDPVAHLERVVGRTP